MFYESRVLNFLYRMESRIMSAIQDLQDAQAAGDTQVTASVEKLNAAIDKLATMNANDAAVELVVADIKKQTAALAGATGTPATSAPTAAPTTVPTSPSTSAPTVASTSAPTSLST